MAEPQKIRDKFAEAVANGRPVMDRLELDTLVTVLDSGSFVSDYASRAPLAARPELGEGGDMRPVVDLLVEQVQGWRRDRGHWPIPDPVPYYFLGGMRGLRNMQQDRHAAGQGPA